jgi:predicted TIM-barrel fold metal-dependent hydrolase
MTASVSQDDYIMMRVRQHGRTGEVTFIDEPEPEKVFCPIISVDDHALEPGTLFEGRLPAKLQDRAPQVVADDNGVPWWDVEGTLLPILMLNGASGRPMNEWGMVASAYSEMRRGVWDSKARVGDMDMTGVWASLCFGSTIWGFAGTRFSKMSDPEVGLACLQAYNDWMIDEWCGADPNRYIPCQLSWLADPEISAREIRKNAERGFRAVSFSENPEGLGFPNIYNEYWEPFFRACEETGTVVNLHVGSSGSTRRPSTDSSEGVSTALFPVSGLEALIDWVFAGIPEKYPALTVALSEAGVSWVPMAYERLNRAHRQAVAIGKGWPFKGSPEELARRGFVYTSIEDPAGFKMLDLIGEDKVMVETDYPHYDSTWPESQAMIRSELTGLAPSTIRKVCYENAARIYRHPSPPAEMIANSEVGAP